MSEARLKIAVILSAYDRMTATINNAVNNAQTKLNKFAKSADNIADKSFRSGQQLVAAGLAVGAPLYQAIDAATEFETKMIGIRKQMAVDTPESVKQMTKDVFKLGNELPVATAEIQDMIAAGLRMGIPQQKIAQYTKDVTKMSVAFDMAAGDIADQMGIIANVFKIPIDQVGKFADVINYLDDNTMAKGPQLIDVLQRIGGTSKYLKSSEAAALASTMLSLGETPERAASGIDSFITVLSAAEARSKKTRTAFMELGLAPGEVQKRMVTDAQGTINDLFTRIAKLAPDKQTSMLSRLFGNEHIGKLQKLTNNMAEYKRQLGLVNGQEKGSMDKEYSKRIAGAAAQKQIFLNKISRISVMLGTTLLPALNNLLGSVGRVFDKVAKFIEANPKLTKGVLMAAAGFSALALVGGYLSFVVGGVAKLFSLAASAASFLGNVIRFLTGVFRVFQMLVSFGFGPAMLIIGALAIAGYFIIKHWDKIKAFFAGVWRSVKETFSKFWTWAKNLFMNYTPHGLIFKHWDKVVNFFSNVWQGVKNLFIAHLRFVMGLGKSFYQAGVNIVSSIWNGIKNKWQQFKNWWGEKIQEIRDFLPFSPAKTGPLRDIHRIKLVETIAASVKPNALLTAMRKVTGVAVDFLTKPGGIGAGVASANGAGMPNVTFNITLNGGATKADAALLTGEIKKQFENLMRDFTHKTTRVSF